METVTLLGVEVLRTGKWNGRTYDGNTLDDLVASYTALCPGQHEAPGKLGHNDDQKLAATLADGGPAVGWITRVYRKGNSLLADFKDVPKTFATLIEKGAYKKRSAEIMFNLDIDGKVWPAVLRAVAWLGEATPAVKGMSDIVAFYADEFDGAKVETVTLTYQFSYEEIRRSVSDSLFESFPFAMDMATGEWLPGADKRAPSPDMRELYSDSAIVWDQAHDGMFKVPYTVDEAGAVALGTPELVRVQYVPAPTPTEALSDATQPPITPMAETLAAKADPKEQPVVEETKTPSKTSLLASMQKQLDDLEKAGAGKKGVSDLRAWYRQSIKALKAMNLPDEEAVKNASDDPATTASIPEGNEVDELELRSLLNIGPEVDIKAHLISLTAGQVALADHEATKAELVNLSQRINQRDADEAITSAIKSGNLSPAQRAWGVATYLSHRESWDKYLESAPKLAHLSAEIGSTGGEADPAGAGPSNEAIEIAKRMGTPVERLSADPTKAPAAPPKDGATEPKV